MCCLDLLFGKNKSREKHTKQTTTTLYIFISAVPGSKCLVAKMYSFKLNDVKLQFMFTVPWTLLNLLLLLLIIL